MQIVRGTDPLPVEIERAKIILGSVTDLESLEIVGADGLRQAAVYSYEHRGNLGGTQRELRVRIGARPWEAMCRDRAGHRAPGPF
jgi:hypothetical protein